jgi:hypothetical protein
MKLPMACMQCFREKGKPSEEFSFVEFRDDGRYEFTCTNGHRTTTILQQQKFEILFDIGAYAILDGYYREAVSSFTSSIERFYEFYIKVIAIEKGIDKDTFMASWKMVSKKSERQLGAFIFLYTLEHGKPPNLLSNANVEVRNDVIHKGKIPTKAEALNYGNAVLSVARPILKELKENYKDSVSKTVSQHLMNCRSHNDKDKPVATLAMRTIVSLSVAEPALDEQTLEEAILTLKKFE